MNEPKYKDFPFNEVTDKVLEQLIFASSDPTQFDDMLKRLKERQ